MGCKHAVALLLALVACRPQPSTPREPTAQQTSSPAPSRATVTQPGPPSPEPVQTQESAEVPCQDATYGQATVDCEAGRIFLVDRLVFKHDSEQLRAASQPRLDELASALLAQPNLRIEIQVHLGWSPPDDRSLILSKRRAEVVRRFLLGAGVTAERMRARGFEDSQPLIESRGSVDDVGFAINSRIEIGIVDASWDDAKVRWAALPWCQGLSRGETRVDCAQQRIELKRPKQTLPRILEVLPELRVRLQGRRAALARTLRTAGIESDRFVACPTLTTSIAIVAPDDVLSCGV